MITAKWHARRGLDFGTRIALCCLLFAAPEPLPAKKNPPLDFTGERLTQPGHHTTRA